MYLEEHLISVDLGPRRSEKTNQQNRKGGLEGAGEELRGEKSMSWRKKRVIAQKSQLGIKIARGSRKEP